VTLHEYYGQEILPLSPLVHDDEKRLQLLSRFEAYNHQMRQPVTHDTLCL
jgi:hypothetical protein